MYRVNKALYSIVSRIEGRKKVLHIRLSTGKTSHESNAAQEEMKSIDINKNFRSNNFIFMCQLLQSPAILIITMLPADILFLSLSLAMSNVQ